MTLGGRKGTAGGHNRICRVGAFNPEQFSSPDGLRTTAFGIREKKKKKTGIVSLRFPDDQLKHYFIS